MSEWPVELPTGEVLRPLPQPAGHPPLTSDAAGTPVGIAGGAFVGARLGSLTARGWQRPDMAERDAFIGRCRRAARSFDRHGMLGRFDPPDDPSHGADLYTRVAGQDTSHLTDTGWLDRLEAITRLEARLAAFKARTIAAFDDTLHGISADLGHDHPQPGDRPAAPGERRWHTGQLRSVSDEIGLVLNLHRAGATTRIQHSWELVHNHPATLQALTDGDLTERAAFTIVDELSALQDPDHLRTAEAAVLAWARNHPLHRIKQVARREAARLDASVNDRLNKRALRNRQVRMILTDHGTAELITGHTATDAAAAMTSLTRAAAKARRQGDTRTLDQLRADIALHRLIGHPTRSDAADGPTGHGATGCHGSGDDCTTPQVRTDVIIHATASEIYDLITGIAGTGGDLEGHGPIPQNTLRQALLAALTIAFTDPPLDDPPDDQTPAAPPKAGPSPPAPTTTSSDTSDTSAKDGAPPPGVIDLQLTDQPPTGNPHRYTPSAALDRYIRRRDRTCRFPGGNRPARYADIDHREPYEAGGETTADNLHCLCRHHHRLKHRGDWTVQQHRDGSQTWTSPTGRTYRSGLPQRLRR